MITRAGDSLVSNILVNPPGISDHCPIHFKIDLVKPGPIRREIIYRKMRNVDRHQFQEDIAQRELINHPADTLPELVDQYHSVIEEILNRHAPLKRAVITIRPHADWFNDEIKVARQKRRKLEKKWRSKPLGERLHWPVKLIFGLSKRNLNVSIQFDLPRMYSIRYKYIQPHLCWILALNITFYCNV